MLVPACAALDNAGWDNPCQWHLLKNQNVLALEGHGFGKADR